MEIKKIVDYTNRSFIASDYLRAPDIYYFMDLVIDDINERLNARFPTFSEWADFVAQWNLMVTGGNTPGVDGEDTEDTEDSEGICLTPTMVPHVHPVAEHMTEFYPPLAPMKPNPLLLRDASKYDAFPDKYLRQVVALGAATKFYTKDEEGEQVALDYQNRYEMALFKMTRDYISQVPPIFQDNRGGFIDFSYNREEGPHDLHPRGVVMNGSNTRIL